MCTFICNLVCNLHLNQVIVCNSHLNHQSFLNLNVNSNFMSLQSPRETLNVDRPLPPVSNSSGEVVQPPSLASDSSEDDLPLSLAPGVSSGADPKLMLTLSSSSSLWLAPPCTSWTWRPQQWQQGQAKGQKQAVKPPASDLTGMS